MFRMFQISLFALALLGASHSVQANEISGSDLGQSIDEQIGADSRVEIRPGRPGRPGYPGRPAMKVCFADNARGNTFRAVGDAYDNFVQQDALRQCRMNSFNPYTCRALGCRFN